MWSYGTLFLYLTFSLIGYGLIKTSVVQSRGRRYGILFIIIWLFWAVARYVGNKNGMVVGGADAITYRSFFDVCLIPDNNHLYSRHTEILFQLLTKGIRLITDNYYIYFSVIYLIILIGFTLFIKEFCVNEMYFIPLIMVGIQYIKSFSLIRTVLSISVILIGLVYLKRRKPFLCLLFMIASVLIQRASIVYAAYPMFYFVYQKQILNKSRAFRFILISSFLGIVFQYVLSHGSWNFFKGGAYDKYILASTVNGFWIDYFKIIIDQVFALFLFLYFSRGMKKWAIKNGDKAVKNFIHLEYMCFYDVLLIPLCGILNIWRANEYFFIPRLIMLGMFVSFFKQRISSDSKKLYNILIFAIIILWFILRMTTIYDQSSLMPYYFDIYGLLKSLLK